MSLKTTSFATTGLYTAEAERKYLNHTEHARFVAVAKRAPPEISLFALTLAYTGLRLSEARLLTHGALQRETRALSVRTLKRRQKVVVREVPIPLCLLRAFSDVDGPEQRYLWLKGDKPVPRVTAYRWIKALMAEAGIDGVKACPRGLRHAYGTRAVLAGIPLHMIQRWMGHASMSTTAIYATVLGPEQLLLADRMWSAQTD